MRLWPRTIRWQIILGLTAVEVLSIGLFSVFLIDRQQQEMRHRAIERLALQATSVSLQTRDALEQRRDEWISTSLKMMSDAPSVAHAKITDPAGNVLFVSEGSPSQVPLEPAEKAQIAQ